MSFYNAELIMLRKRYPNDPDFIRTIEAMLLKRDNKIIKLTNELEECTARHQQKHEKS